VAIKIEVDRIVRITYQITDREGRLLDERTPENYYEYVHGSGQIVGPVERALAGKTAGYVVEVAVSPRDAYGEYNSSLVCDVPREHFPPDIEIEVGMKFSTPGPNGQVSTVRVIEIENGVVTVDGNHPLAGIELNFEVRVLDVRVANDKSDDDGFVPINEEPPMPEPKSIKVKRSSGSLH
jgi:FKBP-type peptidyl-prolyl cis-trans isomerase SlyD